MSEDEKQQDGSGEGDREGAQEGAQPGISDEQLPDDVRPEEDNPLAYGPTDEDDEDEGMSLGGEDGPGSA